VNNNRKPHVHIPDEQRKALVQAILTLISVLLGIAFTLASQLVTHYITPTPATPIKPTPIIQEINPADDAMQTLGATHLTDLYVDNLDASTGLTAQTATITGTLTAEHLTTSDDLTISDALTVTGAVAINNNATITGTLDAQGDLSDSGGDLTVADNVAITGTLDAQGDLSDSGGDLTIADNVAITGTLDVQGGDVTLENDETISNSTDGIVSIGGFLALTEGTVVEVTAAGTITPLTSFQPITSSAVITNAVLADGTVAGQLLALINENAADDITILETGSNLDAGGDVTLTGGAVDALTLLWTGSTWSRLSFEDN
jgi:hypothetical protein